MLWVESGNRLARTACLVSKEEVTICGAFLRLFVNSYSANRNEESCVNAGRRGLPDNWFAESVTRFRGAKLGLFRGQCPNVASSNANFAGFLDLVRSTGFKFSW